MGCDIHGFWEVKDLSGHWMAVDTVNPQRNYEWFGIIAGVRSGPDIGTAQRGIPEDASGAYRDLIDAWSVDLHSHTWLTRDEVLEACNELNRRLAEYYNDISEAHEYVPNADTNVNQLIVGWADNKEHIAWDWFGTVADLMYAGGDIDDCVRMVICFDS